MKKRFTKVLSLILTLCLILSAVPVTASASTIKLNKKKVSIKVGKTVRLKVKGTDAKATWSSSDEAVATVKEDGTVKAQKVGSATITAKVSGKTLTCPVTVKAKKAKAEKTTSENLYVEAGRQLYNPNAYALIKNKNKYAVDVTAKIELYNTEGAKIGEGQKVITGLEAGALWAVPVPNNVGASLDTVKLVIVSAEKSKIDESKLHRSEVVLDIDWNGDRKVLNDSGKTLSEIMLVFIEYDDENKTVIGSVETITNRLGANSGAIISAGTVSPDAEMYVAYAKE